MQKTKYKFCSQLQKSIFLGFDNLVHCCNCTQNDGPVFNKRYKGEKVDWRAVINEKIKLQEKAKKGEIPFATCENCHMLKEDDSWEDGGYINEITISHWTKCNCKCFYCFTSNKKEYYNTLENYSLMPILEDMKKAGILDFSKGGIVRFLGGDVITLKDFDKYVDFFLELGARCFYIPTSGIKFLPVISNILENGGSEVIISADSGSADMYKKIKRIDAYENVKESIRKYALSAKKGNSIFCSKYIVLPYVNDTKEEIDKWLEECLEMGVENIADDVEDNFISKYRKTIPPHIPKLLEYIHTKGEELGFKITRFRYAYQLLYEIEKGTVKIAKNNRYEEYQKKFVERLLKR